MTTYNNFNRGVTFVNAKRTKPTQAEMTGSFNLNDENRTHWLNVWGRVDAEGKVYLDAEFTEILPQGSDYADAERFRAKLYKNEGKGPAYKGEVTLPNEDVIEMVVWQNVNSKDGKPLLSFQVDEGVAATATPRDEIVSLFGDAPAAPKREIPEVNFDDEMPF